MQNWGEDIFKPTIGNKTLHQDSKDNYFRIVNFATSRDLAVKEQYVPPTKTFIHTPGTLLLEKFTNRLIIC